MFTFTTSSSQPSALICSASPTELDLTMNAPGHTLQLILEPCEFRVKESAYATRGLGRQYPSRGLLFFRLFILRSNLGVYETVLCTEPLVDGDIDQDGMIGDLSWSKVYHERNPHTAHYVQEMDDFLQPEGIEPMDYPELKLVAQIPTYLHAEEISIPQRLVDHRLLYDAIVHQPPLSSDSGSIDVPRLMNHVKQTLQDPDGLSRTIFETL